jgi:hypothetical protein
METTPPPVPPVTPAISAEPPPLPPPPAFRLHIGAWIAWGLAGLVIFSVALAQASPLSPYVFSETMGGIVGLLIVPTVFSWLVWRICRRSQRAANIGFLVIFSLSFFGQTAQILRRDDNRAAIAQIKEEQRRLNAEQRALLDSGQPFDGAKAEQFAGRVSESLNQAAKNMTGDSRASAEAGQTLISKMQEVLARYNAASARFKVEQFFEFAPLASAEKRTELRQALSAFAVANEELRAFQEGGGAFLKSELERRGVAEQGVRSTLAGYEDSVRDRLPLMLKIRDCDKRFAAVLLDFIALAEGQLGKWEIDPSDGKIAFETDAGVARFTELVKLTEAIGAEQMEYQKQVLAAGK